MNSYRLSFVVLGLALGCVLTEARAEANYAFGSVNLGADVASGKRKDVIDEQKVDKMLIFDGKNKGTAFKASIVGGYNVFFQERWFFAPSVFVGTSTWKKHESIKGLKLLSGTYDIGSEWALGLLWGIAPTIGVRVKGVDLYLKPALVGQSVKNTYSEKKDGKDVASKSLSAHKIAPAVGVGVSVPFSDDAMFVSVEYMCTLLPKVSHTYTLGSGIQANYSNKITTHAVTVGIGVNFSAIAS